MLMRYSVHVTVISYLCVFLVNNIYKLFIHSFLSNAVRTNAKVQDFAYLNVLLLAQ